jgi:hypothetical protein
MASLMNMATPTTSTAAAINPATTNMLAMATMGLSNNKYILGLIILLINLGARYIGNELNEFSHKILNHKFARRFLIFLVVWMGTRDIVVAIVLTTCFILLSNTLLNEQSTFCILPQDTLNTAVPVTKEEYDVAKKIIEKYEKANANSMQTLNGIFGSNTPPSTTNVMPNMPINNNQVNKV